MERETKTLLRSLQTGGKRLGEGGYGCIFQPPLLCRTGPGKGAARDQKKLGKVAEEKDLYHEIYAANYFEGKPRAKEFFVLPDLSSYCQALAPPSLQREPDLEKCDFGSARYSDLRQVTMDYGGKTFKKELKLLVALPGTFDIFAFMLRLLEIGAYLCLHGYVHNDLHNSNILINDENLPIVIDFGRSYSVKQIDKSLVNEMRAEYAPLLGQIPPESSAMDGVDSGYSLNKILQDLRGKDSIRNAERVLGVSRSKIIREFQRFWVSSRAVSQKDWLSLYQTYWPAVDSWGVGHILAGLLNLMLMSRSFTESQAWKDKQTLCRGVLRGLLRGSPRDRLDCVEALAIYDPMNDLITSGRGRAWLEKKSLQREREKTALIMRGGGGAGPDGMYSDDEDDDEWY